MAFFGLTALGPQNSFQASLKDMTLLSCFTEEEFGSAFARTAQGAESIPVAERTAVLERVYRGEVPPSDLELVDRYFEHVEDETMTRDQFIAHMKNIQAQAAEVERQLDEGLTNACEFNSSTELRQSKGYMSKAPNDKYSTPLTAAQDIGWCEPDPEQAQPIRGKKNCQETVFAAELIKNGIYF